MDKTQNKRSKDERKSLWEDSETDEHEMYEDSEDKHEGASGSRPKAARTGSSGHELEHPGAEGESSVLAKCLHDGCQRGTEVATTTHKRQRKEQAGMRRQEERGTIKSETSTLVNPRTKAKTDQTKTKQHERAAEPGNVAIHTRQG